MIDISSTINWWKLFSGWIIDEWLHSEILFQLGFVAACWLSAYLISLFIQKRIIPQAPDKSENLPLEIMWRVISRILTSSLTLIFLYLIIQLYTYFLLPHTIILKFVSLVKAWTVIRFGSAFIHNPVISHTVTYIIWFITTLDILGYLPIATEWLRSFKISNDANALTLYDIISSALSVTIFIWIAIIIANIITRSIDNSPYLSLSAKALLGKLFKFLLIGAAFMIGLNAVGINLTAFAVFGGAIAVGIGLGLQKVFSNLMAGIILLIDKSIKPGDTLQFSGHYGKVNKLSARYVSMITRDGTEHLIPNDELINNEVENWSYSDTNVRLRIPIGVHYDSDIEHVIKLCIQAAQTIPRVLYHPPPACLMKGFGKSAINLELRIWVRDPMAGCANVKSQTLLAVWKTFKQHHIIVPYPQQDIHIHNKTTESPSIIMPSDKE